MVGAHGMRLCCWNFVQLYNLHSRVKSAVVGNLTLITALVLTCQLAVLHQLSFIASYVSILQAKSDRIFREFIKLYVSLRGL